MEPARSTKLDADLLAMPVLVALRPPHVQDNALAHVFNVCHIKSHQFGALEPASEINQPKRPISCFLESAAQSAEHGQLVGMLSC